MHKHTHTYIHVHPYIHIFTEERERAVFMHIFLMKFYVDIFVLMCFNVHGSGHKNAVVTSMYKPPFWYSSLMVWTSGFHGNPSLTLQVTCDNVETSTHKGVVVAGQWLPFPRTHWHAEA